MLDTNGDKPSGKPSRSKGKAEQPGNRAERPKKVAQPARKSVQTQLDPEQPLQREQRGLEGRQITPKHEAEVQHLISSAASSNASYAAPESVSATVTIVSAQTAGINFQNIAEAYGNYCKKSFAQTTRFFERLAKARSLAGAVEVQTEFAKEAFETFVAEAQRIRELHGELVRQRLRAWSGSQGR